MSTKMILKKLENQLKPKKHMIGVSEEMREDAMKALMEMGSGNTEQREHDPEVEQTLKELKRLAEIERQRAESLGYRL